MEANNFNMFEQQETEQRIKQSVRLIPREHQTIAFDQVRQSIGQGLKRPIVGAATSFGKTILAAMIAMAAVKKGSILWVFCDRIQLINQAVEKFDMFGIDIGVRQAGHKRHNPNALVQIASIQTMDAMIFKHKKELPAMDIVIVDECHNQYKIIDHIMKIYNNIPFIGLSATPYSKALGTKYNNLLVPITARELTHKGYLCPVTYLTGEHVDRSKIKKQGRNAFSKKDLDKKSDEEAHYITGCVVKTWLEKAKGRQTIAFSPTQNISRMLVQKLNDAGIRAEHIDCHTKEDERIALYEAHDRGEFDVLSCSRLLNTGYDAPQVSCIIDCFPTKSLTTWIQRVGRGMRICEGKENLLYLDHAGNFQEFGYADDYVPEFLDDGTKIHDEKELIKKPKDEKEVRDRECPKCGLNMKGVQCKCGYVLRIFDNVIGTDQVLKEAEVGRKANRKDSIEQKSRFYSDLLMLERVKGYKKGYAFANYIDKYGVKPATKINIYDVDVISKTTANWVKSKRIAFNKGKK